MATLYALGMWNPAFELKRLVTSATRSEKSSDGDLDLTQCDLELFL